MSPAPPGPDVRPAAFGGRRRPYLEAAMLAALLVALGFSIATGPARIPLVTVVGVLAAGIGLPQWGSWSEAASAIVWDLRVPRALLALTVGAGLAGSGTVFQGLLRNPLADPLIIGVSAGAAFGATLAITAGLGAGALGMVTIPLFAFAGAVGAMALVYGLARRGSDAPVEDLILAGIAVSAFLAAVVSWMQISGGESLQRVLFWLMGGLSGRSWPHLAMAAPIVAAGICLAWLFGRDLNLLMLGDESARSMGVSVATARLLLVGAGGMMAAAAVASAGLIGFVGLIVPHLMRLVVGPENRRLLLASVLGGAILLLVADLAARSAPGGAELPVGILTAALGAPFFVVVLLRERRRFWT